MRAQHGPYSRPYSFFWILPTSPSTRSPILGSPCQDLGGDTLEVRDLQLLLGAALPVRGSSLLFFNCHGLLSQAGTAPTTQSAQSAKKVPRACRTRVVRIVSHSWHRPAKLMYCRITSPIVALLSEYFTCTTCWASIPCDPHGFGKPRVIHQSTYGLQVDYYHEFTDLV
jgi:hypothetical protein